MNTDPTSNKPLEEICSTILSPTCIEAYSPLITLGGQAFIFLAAIISATIAYFAIKTTREEGNKNRNLQIKLRNDQNFDSYKLEENKLLIQKYEEFSLHLKENYNWSTNLLTATRHDLGSDKYTKPKTSEIHAATTLAILYFPQFEQVLRNLYDHQYQLHEIADSFLLARTEAIKFRLDKPIHSFVFTKPEELIEKFENTFSEIHEKELQLLEEIITQVKAEAPKYRYKTKPSNGKP